MYATGGPVGFAMAESNATLRKAPPLFPTFVDGLRYDPEPFANEMTSRRLSHFEHEPSCGRHNHRGYVTNIIRFIAEGETSLKRHFLGNFFYAIQLRVLLLSKLKEKTIFKYLKKKLFYL